MIALAEIAVVVLICSLGFYAATRQPGGLCDLGSPPQAVLVGQDRAWPPCPRFGPAAWRAERRGAHQLGGWARRAIDTRLRPDPYKDGLD